MNEPMNLLFHEDFIALRYVNIQTQPLHHPSIKKQSKL